MKELDFFVNYVDINFNSINIMFNYFALTVTEMGISKIELALIGAVILIMCFCLMVMNYEIFIFTPIFTALIGFIVFRISKKRKRSAKSIYKLIDDLEKKYIY